MSRRFGQVRFIAAAVGLGSLGCQEWGCDSIPQEQQHGSKSIPCTTHSKSVAAKCSASSVASPRLKGHSYDDEGSLRQRLSLLPESLPFAVCQLLRSTSLLVHARADAEKGRPPAVLLQHAYRASFALPLLAYLPESSAQAAPLMTPEVLRAMEAAAVRAFEDAAEDPLQVATVAWALAWSGHRPGPEYLQKLQAAAAAGALPSAGGSQSPARCLPAAHAAVLLWSAVLHGVATAAVWSSGLRAVAAAAPPSPNDWDDCTLLYLLHATTMYAADNAGPAAAASGVSVVPTSPAAASATPPASQPRPTREDVLAAAEPLGRRGTAKLGQVYGEYVPLHPAIEGPYMALLFVLQQLAATAAAQAAAAAAGRGFFRSSGGASNAGATAATGGAAGPLGWMPLGAPEAAAAVLRSPKDLARIRRDLLYHWRGDESVDEMQRVRNQVIYLLTRRVGLTVSLPEDVDVAVPSRRLALFVRQQQGSSKAPQPLSTTAGSAARTAGLSPAPPLPSSASSSSSVGGDGGGSLVPELLEAEALSTEALEHLVRERFSPQVRAPAYPPSPVSGRDQGRQQQPQQLQQEVAEAGEQVGGMWAARVRQLRRLGWRVVVVDVGTWRGLGGDAEREAYLQRLVRGARG